MPDRSDNPLAPRAEAPLAPADEALPVVARLVVEVRSDGSRTLARGVLEDVVTGQRTQVAARGDTPAALIASLMRTAVGATALLRRAARALLPPVRGRRGDPDGSAP